MFKIGEDFKAPSKKVYQKFKYNEVVQSHGGPSYWWSLLLITEICGLVARASPPRYLRERLTHHLNISPCYNELQVQSRTSFIITASKGSQVPKAIARYDSCIRLLAKNELATSHGSNIAREWTPHGPLIGTNPSINRKPFPSIRKRREGITDHLLASIACQSNSLISLEGHLISHPIPYYFDDKAPTQSIITLQRAPQPVSRVLHKNQL